uniref:(northern house mosquito) hypothetical protein n=1 Tax=Culex pipiens TaxID=7175 RepID=A0A8D8F7I5_CULPI
MSVKSLNVHVDSVTSHPRTYSPQLQVVTSVSQRLDSVSIVSQVVSQSSSAIGFGSSLSEKTSLFSCGTSGSGLRFFDLATLNITQLSGLKKGLQFEVMICLQVKITPQNSPFNTR